MKSTRLLRELCFSGSIAEAVRLLYSCGSKCDLQTYAFLLQETVNRKESKLGRRIHAHIILSGFFPDQYLSSKLLIFYAKDGDLESAHHLFDKTCQPSLVCWNAMISGYVQKGLEEKGLKMYYLMRAAGLLPDQFTFASVLRACARLSKLEHGKRAHCVLIKTPMLRDNVVINSALVDMYFKCTSPCDGRRVFERTLERNVVTWTALLSGYGQHGKVSEVLELFHRMIEEGFRPNWVTFLAVLSACSHGGLVEAGWKYFHSMAKDYGIWPKGEHYAAIVDMLGRAGCLEEAYEFVKRSPFQDHSVVWGALLGACRIHRDGKLGKLAAKNFFKMQPSNVGKHIVLSNTYAALDMWEEAADARQRIGSLGIMKEPASSSIEVQGVIQAFLVGDTSHKENEAIYEILNALSFSIMDASTVMK